MDQPRHLRLLDLHIDLARQRVSRDDVPLDVQGLSFQLLACLLRHRDAVVDFDTLMAEVWAPAVVNEETVTQRVKLLRQALGDDGRQPRYIRSVRGRGYKLCEPPVVAETLIPVEPVAPNHHRGAWIAALGIAVLVLGGAGWWEWHRSLAATTATTSPTQELLQRAAYYAGIGQRDNNERAIGLYQQVLATSPSHAAAQVGLSRAYSARACLYNFPYEWARSAQQLAETVLKSDTRNAAAWSALAYAHDCRGEMQAAIDAYQHAVVLDPADDGSRASAAYLYQERGQLVDALRANLDLHGDASRVRFRDVQIARELDLLGFTEAAEQRFRRSFQLNPDNVFSNIAWPQHLFLQGRLAEAQTALDQAMTRNTPHVGLYVLAGELALLRGDRTAAHSTFDQAVRLRPQMSLPTTLATLYGDTPSTPAWLDTRIAGMKSQLAEGMGYPSDQLELAMLQLARGQRAEALATITAAVQAGYSDRAYLQTSPLLRPLTGEPAYATAIDTISRRMAEQRAQVMAAAWRPAELRQTP
ncbi:Tetratricopeptide repeat-containing protein [Dyella sp. OK004]|uniref:winged helix-turn-helix transcriptional regulator n=1 Tax=Dyella sp. OK004 TaxID=1855292 RepID=UPI0008DECE4E|nr:winged helix-turn-helix transcriptional regulator [Dyella sp. OK004]SFR95983.1 Tetratricopeptide repeat-containing protein [Dyella sp. OK004]